MVDTLMSASILRSIRCLYVCNVSKTPFPTVPNPSNAILTLHMKHSSCHFVPVTKNGQSGFPIFQIQLKIHRVRNPFVCDGRLRVVLYLLMFSSFQVHRSGRFQNSVSGWDVEMTMPPVSTRHVPSRYHASSWFPAKKGNCSDQSDCLIFCLDNSNRT